jgi:hypothetical protein
LIDFGKRATDRAAQGLSLSVMLTSDLDHTLQYKVRRALQTPSRDLSNNSLLEILNVNRPEVPMPIGCY